MSGKEIHLVVWMPFPHPMTGKRVNMLMNYSDRIIRDDEAEELRLHFDIPSSTGSLNPERL